MTTTFDALGRTLTATTADSAVVTTSYSGNTVTATDQTGKSRKSVTDALGRMTAVYEDPTGSNYLTSYSYDILGNLTTVTQGVQTRTFAYDSLKRPSSATNPESGTSSFTYDNNGNLLTRTDARSITTTIVYDALNRPTSKTYQNDPSGTAPINYFYDSQTLPSGAPSFNRGSSIGALVALTYEGGSAGDYFGYDAVGRSVLKIQQTGGINYQINATYSAANAMTSETYPSGRTVSYGYDSAGRTNSVTGTLGDGTNRTYATGIIYSSFGGMTKEQFGTTTPVYNKLFYNVRGQLSEIRDSTSYSGPTDTTWNRGAIINHYSNQCWGMCGGSNSTTSMTDNNGNLKKQELYIPNDTDAQVLVTILSVKPPHNRGSQTEMHLMAFAFNSSEVHQNDFWGRKAVCLMSRPITLLLRQSHFRHNMYYQTQQYSWGLPLLGTTMVPEETSRLLGTGAKRPRSRK